METAILRDGDSEIKEISNMVADLKDLSAGITQRITGGSAPSPAPSRSSSNSSGSRSVSGQNYVENAWGLNMQMVYVEGGEFMIGCTGEQGGDCKDDEKNIHRVSLSGYYIGMLEVTQGQWEKVMGTSIRQQRDKAISQWSLCGEGPDYPMYYVSWQDAMDFCKELSRITGRNYTLPTEA